LALISGKSWTGRLVLMALAVALTVAYYFFAPFLGFTGDEEIPPRVNADGTTDYVLITSAIKQAPQIPKSYWVLRLPSNIAVRPSKTESVGSASSGGASVGFRDRANDHLILYFDEKTLKPMSKEAFDLALNSDSFGKIIRVLFQSSGSGRRLALYSSGAEKNCKELPSSVSGLRAFKFEPSNKPTPEPGSCFLDMFSDDWEQTAYLISDESDQPFAEFRCPRQVDSTVSSECSGPIYFSNERTALAIFEWGVPPEVRLPDLAKAVRNFAMESTLDTGEIPSNSRFWFKQQGL
jgi:hypothetical protein